MIPCERAACICITPTSFLFLLLRFFFLVTKSEVQETNEDPDVIRSEIGEMRQSVVSMSVGQPKTATRIVKEWLEDDVVPEPEPPPEEPEEEDSGKKKKKKK